MTKKKKVILFASIAGCAVLLGIIAALIFSSLGTGSSFHSGGSCSSSGSLPKAEGDPTPESVAQVSVAPTEEAEATVENQTPEPDATSTPIPTPTVDPYEALMEKADTTMMKDIVNVLLIGVDYSDERQTWNGKKEWHSDVMIVLAINFAENRADMITLPRDTYASIPHVKGIYKLNASLNCGGGLFNDDGTFNPKGPEKVCEAAEWMLGGIPVDYYYAVTMTSLKELVDVLGGLEYDMDINFRIQGRSYEKGLQHIDGQAFLDYCRIRKNGANAYIPAGQEGDAKRVERQKRILIALFKQLKADQMIVKIPEIIDTFDGDLFTNCTFAQTASLAAFAYHLDPDNINMYSMSGTMQPLYQWNFCFTNQTNRVDIVNKVYHQKVKSYSEHTLKYARYHWCDMLYEHYMELLNPLTKYVQKLIDEDDKLPEFTSEPETPDPTKAPKTPGTDTPKPTNAPTEPPTDPATEKPTEPPTEKPTEPPTEPPAAPTEPPSEPSDDPGDEEDGESVQHGAKRGILHKGKSEETRQYTSEDRELFQQYKTCLEELETLHKEADKEAKKYKNGKSNSLDDVGQKYLKKLAEIQTLAIKVAKSFHYDKVKNFTTSYAPTGTYWNTISPWAINYGLKKSFNEIKVDFN